MKYNLWQQQSSRTKGAAVIYTITFNPSVDVLANVDQIALGGESRAVSQRVRYGGAGIDVSRGLRNLGRPSTAWGFLAGPIGRAMDESLSAEGLDCQFVMLPEGDTRINVKVCGAEDVGGRGHIAVRGQGPVVDKVSQLGLFGMLQSTRDDDLLIVSGDVPGNVSPHAYARILESQKDKKVLVAIDASGELMLNALQHRPFLAKASVDDIADLVECSASDLDGLVQGARLLHELGARNVLVLGGRHDVIMVDEEGVLRKGSAADADAPAPASAPAYSQAVEASLMAGFVHGYLEGREQGLETDALYDRAFATAQAAAADAVATGDLASAEGTARHLSLGGNSTV